MNTPANLFELTDETLRKSQAKDLLMSQYPGISDVETSSRDGYIFGSFSFPGGDNRAVWTSDDPGTVSTFDIDKVAWIEFVQSLK